MEKLRFFLALWISKVSKLILKITKHNATNFPGVVALKICPNFLKYVQYPQKLVGVTGTNGKTTVSNLLTDSLRMLGKNVLNNSEGSNINSGIATTMMNSVNFFNKQKNDIGVLEIDELSMRRISDYVKPDILLITNLSRDSVMRNAHPEYIRGVIENNLSDNTKLILNADDLLSCFTRKENERVYFSIDRLESDSDFSNNLIDDMKICPKCNSPIAYEYNRYSNIGKAYCTHCDFKSPEGDMRIVKMTDKNIDVLYNGEVYSVKNISDSIFNAYNELALITILKVLGYDFSDIASVVEKIQITKSRYDVTEIAGRKFYFILAKDRNAYATSRVLEYVMEQEGNKEILLYNNNFDDALRWSENVSWIYDCDFELLADDSVKGVITTADRGLDYKLRLLTAGIPKNKIHYAEDPVDGVNYIDFDSKNNIFLLYGTDTSKRVIQAKKMILDELNKIEGKL